MPVTNFDYLLAIIRQKNMRFNNYKESYEYSVTNKSQINVSGN